VVAPDESSRPSFNALPRNRHTERRRMRAERWIKINPLEA
jgi:hypothetical protein